MMEEKDNLYNIHVNSEIYQLIQNFCEESGFDENELVNGVLQHFLKESLNIIDTMRKGYAEMAHINLDISSEFEICEEEVSADF